MARKDKDKQEDVSKAQAARDAMEIARLRRLNEKWVAENAAKKDQDKK